MSANHDHNHSHSKSKHGKAFAIGIFLNLFFVGIEAVYGYVAHSLALLADAGHNLSDVLGLALAWGASYLSTRKVSSRYSYGLKSSSIMAAFLNAIFLLVAIGGILWEAIQRIEHPNPIEAGVVMCVAAIGILVNGFTAWLFMAGQKEDINIRAAFLHMASDALVSVGVVLAGLIYLKTGWLWLDPVVSIGISIVIIFGTYGLLKESVNLSLHAVPQGINFDEVRTFLESQVEVKKVHDLHIWAMSTTDTALTCHLVLEQPELFLKEGKLLRVLHDLDEKFHIEHSTIQLDRVADVHNCIHD